MPPILIHKGWLVIWYGRWWCWWQDWFLPNGILMPCWFLCRRFCGCVLTPLWCWYKAWFSLSQTWAGYLNGRLIRLVLCSYWRLSGSRYRCYGFWQSITLVMDWACSDYAVRLPYSVFGKKRAIWADFQSDPVEPVVTEAAFMRSLSFWLDMLNNVQPQRPTIHDWYFMGVAGHGESKMFSGSGNWADQRLLTINLAQQDARLNSLTMPIPCLRYRLPVKPVLNALCKVSPKWTSMKTCYFWPWPRMGWQGDWDVNPPLSAR